MGTHLSRYFKQLRLDKRLGYGDVARLCGHKNVVKGANKIIRFEERGSIHPDLFDKLKSVLDADDARVDELILQDQEAYCRAWHERAIEPVVMIVFCRPTTAYSPRWRVPSEITTEEEAVVWASEQAKSRQKPLTLRVNRSEAIRIDENGEIENRKSLPLKVELPYLQIRKTRFQIVEKPDGLAIELDNTAFPISMKGCEKP